MEQLWYHYLVAGREDLLVTGEYYHIFNRGVAKSPTFVSQHDYQQAMLGLNYYRFVKPPIKLSRYKRLSIRSKAELLAKLSGGGKRLVDIICFVFMPNHFHFLLKQAADNGISKYLSLFTNSYTRYFNTKFSRPGPMFQGVFKSVHVNNNAQLLHLSRYIHLNPYVSGLVTKSNLPTYPWSSLPDYLVETKGVINPALILSQFKSTSGYRDFVLNHADYARELELVKHLTIDIELD